MAGNIKQVVERIRNKIPFNKGISRLPVNSLPGYLGDMENFEQSDGTTKNRLGSRVINHMSDNMWYHIETFQICGVNVTLGLNYKRELWAWLPKWPEVDFKVYNTSPFRTYRHTDPDNGIATYSGHFSFSQGNKFWMKEDAQTVIIFSDYAEIFRIMKNGSFRITADADYSDQREAIQDIRDDKLAIAGRLYLDIKEATNRVFDERMYIGEEYIRRSHRITGETRFAWVNELGVVSELSDPVNIEGYKHVVASAVPLINYNKIHNGITIKRVADYGATADTGCNIFNLSDSGVEVGATEGNVWHPANPLANTFSASAIILELENAKYYDGLNVPHDIADGTYICISNTNTDQDVVLDDSESWNYNAVKFKLQTPKSFEGADTIPYPWPSETKIYQLESIVEDVNFPSLKKVDFTKPITVRYDEFKSNIERYFVNYLYDGSSLDGNVDFVAGAGKWHKMKNLSTSDVVSSVSKRSLQITQRGNNITNPPMIIGYGRIYECDMTINFGVAWVRGWNEQNIVGFEAALDIALNYSQWTNLGYDCWRCLSTGLLNIDSIDMQNMVIKASNIDVTTDIITQNENPYDNINSRFALWNNSHIMGISQRAFADYAYGTGITTYTGNEGSLTNNLNYQENVDPTVLDGVFRIAYPPLMTLDFTGLRRIPMPLPLIRRAMRNPQHIAVSGGYVYSVEDSSVWYGKIEDCMMVDSIQVNASVYQIAEFDSGIILATNKGLLFADVGSPIQSVVKGESIFPKFLVPCSGGVLAVQDRDIYIIYKHVTDKGAWYPSTMKINSDTIEINLEGEIKSVSIGRYIYLSDDYTVWRYDMETRSWSGKYTYGSKIHRLFTFNGKLAISFDSDVDKKLSFDRPRTGQQ